MFDVRREIEELERKLGGRTPQERSEREWAERGTARFGTVADNKDPMCLGRIRVACDMIAPGVVTPWIPVVSPGASKNSGWWLLPDIGAQVLLGFLGKGHGNPVAVGYIYDLKHLPPKHTTENPSKSMVWQTQSHRVEFIDEEGKEELIISSAKGKMRLRLTAGKGIELINELGDIRIKCRKLKLEGKEGVTLAAEKKIRISSGGGINIYAKKKITLESGKEAKLSGKNIRLEGSQGVTTGGKQLAAEGDKVMGFDVHQMEVPSGNGTAIVPLPHPFIGKLADKLSDNVKVKGHNAAVKGSVAKHDDAVHNQLPGTIKFQQNPKKEGEVSGGTAGKLKINGKEAAVVGSTVSTCNDVGARDNSVVMAAGASIPMPVIINPKNMEEYNLEREQEQTREPEFTAAKWVNGSVKEGVTAELSAQVKDIDDGNTVTFQVWKGGQDPAVHIALKQIVAAIEGGAAKGQWVYRPPAGEVPPDNDPQFFFTVHSAWCPFERSGELTVELRRPEITGVKWRDGEGKESAQGLEGVEMQMSAECNADMEEGAGVTFRVFKEGADTKKDVPEYEVGAANKGGTAEAG